MFSDATRDTARQLGFLPGQTQSILWDGGRILFPSEWKTEDNKAEVVRIWKEVNRGKLTPDQARQRIFDFAGGWENPRPTTRHVQGTTPTTGGSNKQHVSDAAQFASHEEYVLDRMRKANVPMTRAGAIRFLFGNAKYNPTWEDELDIPERFRKIP